MSNRKPITAEGKKKLEKNLEQLIQVERPKVLEAIKEARSHGDLSENADYDIAKEQKAILESRIAELTEQLTHAEVIDVSKVKSNTIAFGARVKLKNLDNDKSMTYFIVGEAEADAKSGYLSIGSPLAKKMIGLKKGEIFIFQTPGGEEKEYEVKDFSFDS